MASLEVRLKSEFEFRGMLVLINRCVRMLCTKLQHICNQWLWAIFTLQNIIGIRKDDVLIYHGDANMNRVSCSSAKFSDDGCRLAVVTPSTVVIYDSDSGKVVLQIPAAGVVSIAFSPRGTYLQTFQKPQGQQKNLTLWDITTGSIALQQFQKTITKNSWSVSVCSSCLRCYESSGCSVYPIVACLPLCI